MVWTSRVEELAKTRESGASAHVVALCCFSDTDECPFHRTTLEELPPRPLRLVSFITEPQQHSELNLCDGFIDLHCRGQGLAAQSVDGSALRTHVKWTQTMKFCKNPKTWSHGCFAGPAVAPHCGARALTPSSPKLFMLSRWTSVMVRLTRRASARACRIGTRHMAKWTADLWAFHCSCAVMHCQLAVPHVWHKHAQGTCQDCGYEPDMTPVRSSCHHPAHSIEHTSSLSQCVPHCNTFFNVKTFRNFVSYPEKG